MGEEAPAHVSGAIAAWSRAGHAVCLARLPDELRAVNIAVLLPLGRQGAAGGAAVGGVLPSHMTLPVAPRDWTPERRNMRSGSQSFR